LRWRGSSSFSVLVVAPREDENREARERERNRER